MTRAGLYARVSREEQAEGYSIGEQLAAMRRYCDSRAWEIGAEYVEPGVSGTTGDRPALKQALADCEARRLDVLVTHQLDRLARNLRLQLEILSSLGRWSVGYISAVEQIDWSTPQGALFLAMLGAFNEYYVANLRRETKKGKLGRAKAGLTNASILPWGYLRVDGADVPDPAAAPAVRLAFDAYATGAYSDTAIAGLLNERGYPPSTHARSGAGRWTREGIRYLLNNPAYAGQVRYGRDVYPGQQPPLISPELYSAVARIRARRSHGRAAGQHPRRVYLLSRLATCAHCGLRLTASPSSHGEHLILYYGCPSGRRGVDCPAAGHWLRVGILDQQIGAIMRRLILPPDWRARLQELAAEQQPDEEAGRRRSLEGRLARLHDVYIAGDLVEHEYRRRRADLRAQLDQLAERHPSEVLEAGEAIESLGEEWSLALPDFQRDIVHTLFEEIQVDTLEARVLSVRPFAEFAVLFHLAGEEVQTDGRVYIHPPAAES